MIKMNLTISIFTFLIFLGITSVIKNQTRTIEKMINKIDKNTKIIKKDLNETQLDYFYLSSPVNLEKKIQNIDFIKYEPMSFSKIYLDFNDFINTQKNISNLDLNNEKETKKK